MTWIVRGGQQLELEECGRAGALGGLGGRGGGGGGGGGGASVGVRVPRQVAAAARLACYEWRVLCRRRSPAPPAPLQRARRPPAPPPRLPRAACTTPPSTASTAPTT
ncbi:homeobox protein Hox-D11-like [Spodoptera frugiperda]|uniref:Homeobox protein Hox-D11-like n=1 Tax=Spodoptera frugiperda TaxID=7108 RepID=A0A9R0D6X2_SPOFR|nr:homeobox protein Hox-D11-like [Spodoptera frugiperda]